MDDKQIQEALDRFLQIEREFLESRYEAGLALKAASEHNSVTSLALRYKINRSRIYWLIKKTEDYENTGS